MHRIAKQLVILSAFAVLAAACGSLGGLGDLGDILGSSGPADSSDIEGTVTGVDERDRRIDLDVYRVNNLRRDEGNRAIYYDADTVVYYEGERYEPSALEQGDVIEARGANVDGRYVADEIDVVRNVRER